jgi:hypothetical protein
MLRDEGLLEFRRGRGITVVGTPERSALLEEARSLVRHAREHGYRREELIRSDRPAVVEATLEKTSQVAVAAPEGPWRLTLQRIRGDRWTLAAGCLLGAIVFCSFAGGSIASAVVRHTSTDQFPYAANDNFKPVGPWTRVSTAESLSSDQYGDILPPPQGTPKTLLVLGADSVLGRDEMLRLLDGGRTSLEIGLFAVFFALVVGNLLVDLLYAVIDPRAGLALRDRETKSLAGGVI